MVPESLQHVDICNLMQPPISDGFQDSFDEVLHIVINQIIWTQQEEMCYQ